MKEILGIIAIALSFAAYIPYFISITKGETKPHIYSWLVWGIVTVIAFILQLGSGGGLGSFTTLIGGLLALTVYFLALKNGDKYITKSDKFFLVLSFITILFWLITKDSVTSSILVAVISVLGFVPTIRKAWHKPREETVPSWALSTIRQFFALLALQGFNFVTVFYPILWIVLNGTFTVILVVRRKLVA